MERHSIIDLSLPERQGILLLLERVRSDNVTADEMEEIGARLSKAGRRALPPLMRRLWRERRGEMISRYTYLLDYFDDDAWLDQLVQIALRRRDLEGEGRDALLRTLALCGIDVSGPPFISPGRAGSSFRESIARLLATGEEGRLIFVEDLLAAGPELRPVMIGELAVVGGPAAVELLRLLLGIDDQEIARASLQALGRLRSGVAAGVLAEFAATASGELARQAETSRRRLAFLGVAEEPLPPRPRLPWHTVAVSPFDGTGNRTCWLARRNNDGTLATLSLQLHDTRGMRAAAGADAVSEEEFARQLDEMSYGEGVIPVAPDYASLLIRDAIHHNVELGVFMPAEFYLCLDLLSDLDLTPAPYLPSFADADRELLGSMGRLIAASPILFDDRYLAGWFLATARVYDFAEEWQLLEGRSDRQQVPRGLEEIVERFSRELLIPEVERFQQRLLLTADLMQHTSREKRLVELVLATAWSIDNPPLQEHHPFLRRFALESMEMAREALAEGYDLREHPEDEDGDDDEGWE